ncbi:DUF541 domain-containing protein [Siminovitchia terrae]|uniref:DUF541 domain-containing protein n=2 Tax=Siminovitchia terrae TaxID=1914933 RepID=A0A429XC92_SIMTE|nr:DUF541 domain-containing protein [Siminovitchia terrae]
MILGESGEILMYYPLPYKTVKTRPNVIKVSGEGKISVEPEIAVVRLGVSTESLTLAQAQEENARAISNIKKAFTKAGIPENAIKTDDYSIYPQHDYVEGQQVFRNYRVDHMLLVKVIEINQAGPIVDIAVRNGANIVSGVTFEAAQNDQFYRKALSFAVLDARRKAETIAETLNVQLSKVPFSIAEINDREVIPYQKKTFAMNEASTSLHPGTLEIISRVQAEFSYVSM